jgi:hypothetical protein
MIIYANIETPTADLHGAASDKGMTVPQFVAWATNSAVEEWRRYETARLEFIAALDATIKEQHEHG